MAARKKYHEPTRRVTLTIKAEMLDWVDEEAKARGTDRPEIVFEALRQWRHRLDKARGKEASDLGASGVPDLPGQTRFLD